MSKNSQITAQSERITRLLATNRDEHRRRLKAEARVAEWQAERNRMESLMVLWTRSDAIRRGCAVELRAALAKEGE